MAFEQFPYTNFHELNTDWVLKTLKDLKTQAETLQAQAEAAIQGVEDWESRVQAAEAAAQDAEEAAETAEAAAVSADAAANNADSRAAAAADSATAAAASATAAQTQATNAAASASAAQTQATNAATSASAAQTQATNAAASAASAISAAQAAKAGYYEITLDYPVTDQSSNITLPDANFQDFLGDIDDDEKPIIVKLIQAGNGQGVIDTYAYLPARIYDWDQNKIELELEYNLIVYHITWFYPGEGTSHYTRWIATDKVPPAVASGNSGKFLKSTGSSMTWDTVNQPPAVSSGNIGRFLKSTGSSMAWTSIREVPATPQEDVGKFLTIPEGGGTEWAEVSQYNPLIVTFSGTTGHNPTCDNTLQNILNAVQAGNLIVKYKYAAGANQNIYYSVPNFYWENDPEQKFFYANATWYNPDESDISFAVLIQMTGDTQNDLDIYFYEL